eukprot:gene42922-53604_t
MNGTSSIRARYALGSDGLKAFIATAGIELEMRDDACQPAATATRPPPIRVPRHGDRMSTNTLITRTSGRGLEPLHVRLLDRYGQIAGTLTQTLGPAHAALFAEPVRMGAGAGSDIAWYAEGDVDPVPFAALSPDAAARAQQRLERLLADIAALAERLMARQNDVLMAWVDRWSGSGQAGLTAHLADLFRDTARVTD